MTAPHAVEAPVSPATVAAPAPNAGRAGDAAALVASQLVAAASTFGTGVVLARTLGPAGKGFVDVTLATATLLQMLSGLSLGSGVFFVTARGAVDHRRLLRVALAFSAAIGAAALLLLPLADTRVGGWLLPAVEPRLAALLVAGLLVALHAQQLLQGLAKGRGFFRAFGRSEVVARGGTLALVAGLALAATRSPTPYVVAFVAATLASAVLLTAATWRDAPRTTALPLRQIFVYSLPLYLGNVVQFLNYRLDVFFVKESVGLDGVGRYTVAVWIAQTVWLVPNALAALVLRAVAADPTSAATRDRVGLLHRGCLLLGVACAAVLALAAGPGLRLVFGDAFAASVPALLVLLPGTAVFSSVVILSAHLNGLGRQALTTWVACGSLVVTVVLNVLLVPRFGILGAALASTASYVVSAIATFLLVRRVSPELTVASLLLPTADDVRRLRDVVRARIARSDHAA